MRASGASSSCIAPGRLRADMASEVLSRPDGEMVWCPMHGEAGGVVGIVLDVLGEHVERVERRGRTAADGSAAGSWLASRAASALLTTGTRSAAGMILVQPLVALREALAVSVDAPDALRPPPGS